MSNGELTCVQTSHAGLSPQITADTYMGGLSSRRRKQSLKRLMLPNAQQFDGIGAVWLTRCERVGTTVRTVTALAGAQTASLVVESDRPPIRFDGHVTALNV